MELGKYIKAKRSMLRRKGGLNTVIPVRYDVGDPNFDYRVGEQSYQDGGVVQRENFSNGTKYLGDGLYEVTLSDGSKSYYGKITRDGLDVKTSQNKNRKSVEKDLEKIKQTPKAKKGLDIESQKYPKGYGTARQFAEKAREKGISLTDEGFVKNTTRFINKYNIKRKVNPYAKDKYIFDLTALDKPETVEKILKAQVKGPAKKTSQIKKFIKGEESKREASRKYYKQKKDFSSPYVEKILEGTPETVKSHMTSLKSEIQTPEKISYTPARTNFEFIQRLETEFDEIMEAQKNLIKNKPKNWKATFDKLNDYGVELSAASDGEKAFTIKNYDGSDYYTYGGKTGLDPADIFKGKTMKDIEAIYKKKNKTPADELAIRLFETNKDAVFKTMKKTSPTRTTAEADKIVDKLKKIKPQDAVNAISNLACKDKYTDGGRVNFKKGSNCFLRGAEIIQDAKAGNPSALQKVRKYLKTPAARVGLGVLAELGIEGLFAVESIAEGKPYDQVLGESLFGLVGFGSTEEEQILKHANPKDIENVKAYQKKLANEGKLDSNVAFEKMAQPETGEESTEDFFTVESLRPAMDKQRKQLQKDFLDPNLDKEEEAYGRAYRNYLEANKQRAESGAFGRTLAQSIRKNIYDPTGKAIMEAYETVKDLFAEGGRVEMSEGGDPKDKMKTPFDKPTLPLDPNQIPQVQNPSRRGFIKGAGFIGAGIAAFAAGLLRLGRKESAQKLVQKAATYGGRRIDGVPEIISDLIQTIKLKGQVIDAPKPGSGPVVYKYNKYEYVEDINGFTINKVNDRGDYGYSEEVFQFEKDPETGAVFFDDITVKPDGDGKLKDVEYGVDTETYDEIADDLARFNHIHPNDTRFKDKARKWIDEERLKNEGIEPKPGTDIYE